MAIKYIGLVVPGGVQLCKVEINDVSTQTTSWNYLSAPGIFKAVLRNNQIVYYKMWPLEGKFDVHDVNTNTWAVGTLPDHFLWPSVISVGNTVYVAGGCLYNFNNTFDNFSDKAYILDF